MGKIIRCRGSGKGCVEIGKPLCSKSNNKIQKRVLGWELNCGRRCIIGFQKEELGKMLNKREGAN